MIIRGVEVENWRCLQSVRLTELTEGINVLHGPNRTGKSSLFEAVRYCLFDYDCDTTSKAVKAVVPRETDEAPRVTVDFETDGNRYRIMKLFAQRKGEATLERWTGSRWEMQVRDPKEAGRAVHELLSMEKSDAGLNLLLWIEQGRTHLPSPSELDLTLTKQLEQVLGTLVTGQDLEVRQRLEELRRKWYTATGRHRTGSAIEELEERRKQLEETRKQVEAEIRQADTLVSDFDATRQQITLQQGELEKAEKDIAELRKQREACRERIEKHRVAVEELKRCRERAEQSAQTLKQYKELEARKAEIGKQLEKDQRELQERKSALQKCRQNVLETEAKLQAARQTADRHEERRAAIDARRRLLETTNAADEIARRIAEAEKLDAQITEIQETLAQRPDPSKSELDALRKLEQKRRTLKAELEAAGLHLAVDPEQTVQAELTVDAQEGKPVELQPGLPIEYQARQRLRLVLDGFGTIEIRRGKQDDDIEQLARELRKTEERLTEDLDKWAVPPEEEDPLSHLVARQEQRHYRTERLAELKRTFEQLAPEGLTDAKRRHAELQQSREAILRNQPELRDWTPDAQAIQDLREEFEEEQKRLKSQIVDAQDALKSAQSDRAQAEKTLQEVKERVTRAGTTVEGLEERLQALGKRDQLNDEAEATRKAVAEAEKKVAETKLTREESLVDQRLNDAQTALERREQRLHAAERRLSEIRGELRKTEGLHTRKMQVEQELNTTIANLQREQLEADACSRLVELFDQLRNRQVQSTMEPITQRVLEWARLIGLTQYADLAYDEDFLPDGLRRDGATPEDAPIEFSDESYGTVEQLALLVRLALGGLLAADEPQVAILDDPLAHSDDVRHRNMLDILRMAAAGEPTRFGPLQMFILTCHPERFDRLTGARLIDLAAAKTATV